MYKKKTKTKTADQLQRENYNTIHYNAIYNIQHAQIKTGTLHL